MGNAWSDTWGAPLEQGHPIHPPWPVRVFLLPLQEKQPLGRRWGQLLGSSRVFQAHGNRVGKDTAPELMKAGRIFSRSPYCCCAGSSMDGLFWVWDPAWTPQARLLSWAGPQETSTERPVGRMEGFLCPPNSLAKALASNHQLSWEGVRKG